VATSGGKKERVMPNGARVGANDEPGVWVYAIMRADCAAERIVGLRGVAREPIRVVFGADLAAAVGTVMLNDDREWLTASARTHNAVITAIRRRAPVIPVRMATIYRDDWRVSQMLLNERDYFEGALRRVTGREEIDVAAYADPKRLAIQGDLISSHAVESRASVVNLLRRRRQLASRRQGYRLALTEADRVHDTLTRHAVDAKRKPASDDWAVLNGAYLVDAGVVGRFLETVGTLERSTARITLEVTGPWPPFSFAEDLIAI
jgi:hypothetical protein